MVILYHTARIGFPSIGNVPSEALSVSSRFGYELVSL